MNTDDFLNLLLTGQYLPAIGLALIAFVSVARALLTGVSPWFATKPGGYLVGFTSAALLFLSASLAANQVPTPGVIAGALGAGWAASGGFEMIRDLLAYLRRKKAAAPSSSGLVGIVLLLSLAGGAAVGCGAVRPYAPPVTYPIVDCGAEAGIDALIVSWFTRRPSWSTIKDEAIDAGVEVGGCAFAKYLDKYLAPAPGTAAPPPEEAVAAKDAFEQYRNKYALNASFRFADGDR